ncbi:MAG TPA: ATP-binding protein [Pirellulales bacterium]|jgi:hypothetical protein|nr:ATP-binding protein [Pirellulales bacterium]
METDDAREGRSSRVAAARIVERSAGGRQPAGASTCQRMPEDSSHEPQSKEVVAERDSEHERLLESERLSAIGAAMNAMAHESRNALQRAQACLEMLAREVQDRPAALDLIARVQQAQNDLHQLYEKVRDYASPLRIDPQRHALSPIIRQAWLELESLRVGRNARLREEYTGSDPTGEIDRRAMTIVFSHLLKNSLAACPDPLEIDVSYRDSELNGQPALEIVLQDNGPGFAPADRDKAFAAFYTTRTRGTGLGLALTKRIVEAHGGQIRLGAGSRAGAQFVLIFPRRKS